MSFGDFEGYRKRFEKVQTYFAPRVEEATRLGNEMIAKIFEKTREEAGEEEDAEGVKA